MAGGSVRLRLGTPAGPRAVRVAMVAGGCAARPSSSCLEPRAAGRAAVTVDRVWPRRTRRWSRTGPLGELRLQGRVLARPLDGGNARFPLTDELFGRPVRLASGTYRLDGRPGGVAPSAALQARLPEEDLGTWHRARAAHRQSRPPAPAGPATG
ncbi:MAG: hypothetical protein R2734_03790 [Nocardioides sp.]